jgi:hypothetical protein
MARPCLSVRRGAPSGVGFPAEWESCVAMLGCRSGINDSIAMLFRCANPGPEADICARRQDGASADDFLSKAGRKKCRAAGGKAVSGPTLGSAWGTPPRTPGYSPGANAVGRQFQYRRKDRAECQEEDGMWVANCPRSWSICSAVRPRNANYASARAFLIASTSGGTTSKMFATTPTSAISKMGASASLLMATMVREPFMPTMCWMAPLMPSAM